MNSRTLISTSLLAATVLIPGLSSATLTPCSGRVINPVTDICWECMYPMTIGSTTVVSGNNPDTPNPDSPVCFCPGDPLPQVGTALGYWEPVALVEVTRSPFCLVNLGGVSIGDSTYDGAVAVNGAN